MVSIYVTTCLFFNEKQNMPRPSSGLRERSAWQLDYEPDLTMWTVVEIGPLGTLNAKARGSRDFCGFRVPRYVFLA